MQISHNFIREHEGLKGKTPAEAEGITVGGQNKWLTIIQNAAHEQQEGERTKLQSMKHSQRQGRIIPN
jgi:hypothetical protein